MSDSRIQWKQQAERLLASLRDIVGASISLDDDGDVTEVNILAVGHRPPKQIVRDVRSALRAEYQIDLDYRRISVAQKSPESGETREARVLSLPSPRVQEEPLHVRLRLQELTTTTRQESHTVRVELSMGKVDVVGEATGGAGRYQTPRLVAEATLQAIERLLEDGSHLVLLEVAVQPFAGKEIALVGVRFAQNRGEKVLTGSCLVDRDVHQAVVFASLDAMNRILGRLEYREATEFEVHPTSLS